MLANYYRELLNHLTRTIKDRESAADITQEAYLRILTLQHAGKVILQPRALLYHIARNLIIDNHRRAETRGESAWEDEAVQDLDGLTGPSSLEPETALESLQAVNAMLSAIENLPLRCREAFILHRFDGLSHAEVAQRMGITRKAVEQHIKLAMEACRRCSESLDSISPLARSIGK